MSHNKVCVAAFYQFAQLDNFAELRRPLLERMLGEDVKGSVLLAKEGVNGTISGTNEGVKKILAWLQSQPRLIELQAKYSQAKEQPFYRSKVKLKREIVTMGVKDLAFCPGQYIPPEQWNDLITSEETLLVDTRNNYEYEIGTFKGAINPDIENFRQFTDYLNNECNELMQKQKKTKLAMFCTGGIRCEKSTSLANAMGFDEIFHLQGGILSYLEKIPQEQSLWQGECFVFDNRVSVGHGLKPGSYIQCHACRYPITEQDTKSKDYIPGVQCPKCVNKRTQQQKARSAERQHQMELAKQAGRQHLADNITEAKERKRKQKELAKEESQRQ